MSKANPINTKHSDGPSRKDSPDQDLLAKLNRKATTEAGPNEQYWLDLHKLIHQTLDGHESFCLDYEGERRRVGNAIYDAVADYIYRNRKPSRRSNPGDKQV